MTSDEAESLLLTPAGAKLPAAPKLVDDSRTQWNSPGAAVAQLGTSEVLRRLLLFLKADVGRPIPFYLIPRQR